MRFQTGMLKKLRTQSCFTFHESTWRFSFQGLFKNRSSRGNMPMRIPISLRHRRKARNPLFHGAASPSGTGKRVVGRAGPAISIAGSPRDLKVRTQAEEDLSQARAYPKARRVSS